MRKICKKRNFFWNNQKEQTPVGLINDGQYPLKINTKIQKEVDKKTPSKMHQKRAKKEVEPNNTPIVSEPRKTQVNKINEEEKLKKLKDQQEKRRLYQIEYQKNYNRKHPRGYVEENLKNLDILDKPEEKKKIEKEEKNE